MNLDYLKTIDFDLETIIKDLACIRKAQLKLKATLLNNKISSFELEDCQYFIKARLNEVFFLIIETDFYVFPKVKINLTPNLFIKNYLFYEVNRILMPLYHKECHAASINGEIFYAQNLDELYNTVKEKKDFESAYIDVVYYDL